MGKGCEMFYLFFGFFLDTKIMECLFLLLLLLLLSPIPRTDFRAWVVRLRFSFFLLLLMLMSMSMSSVFLS